MKSFIEKSFANIFMGPAGSLAFAGMITIQKKAAKLKGVKRAFVVIPAILVGAAPFYAYPLAIVIDRLVSPLLVSMDIKTDKDGNNVKNTAGQKIRAWTLLVPKLVGTIPLAAVTAGVMALAIVPLCVFMVVQTMQGKPFLSK